MAGVRKNPSKSGKYRGWFISIMGKQKSFTGTRNKNHTLKMAQRIEDEHRQVRLGYRPPPDPSSRHKNTPFQTIRKEYTEWGASQGGRNGFPWSKTHARNRLQHLDWWENQLKLEIMMDLVGCLPRAESALRSLQQKNKAGKTLSAYAETLNAFCVWAVQRNYLEKNPVQALKKFDATPQSQRRAMTKTEINQLLNVCKLHERLLLETAFTTGLRANELRSLTVAHLDTAHNRLRLDAEWTKNRKAGFQPLPQDLVERLKIYAKSTDAQDHYRKHAKRKDAKKKLPQNPLLYVPSHTARTLDRLLSKAGIPKNTQEGKLDFHACRVAFITMVIESGANIKQAQSLARHSSPQITMNIYAKTRDDQLQETVESLAHNLYKKEETVV